MCATKSLLLLLSRCSCVYVKDVYPIEVKDIYSVMYTIITLAIKVIIIKKLRNKCKMKTTMAVKFSNIKAEE